MALKPQGNNILAGTSLAIAQIQSPDYVPGVSGWCIFQNGNAEFNQGTFRGFIVGGSLFIYNGTPALGNPPISWMSSATVDPFGNTLTPAIAGETPIVGAGQDGAAQVTLVSRGSAPQAGLVEFPVPGTFFRYGSLAATQTGIGSTLFMLGPADSSQEAMAFELESKAVGGTSATYLLIYFDPTGGQHTQMIGTFAGMSLPTVTAMTAVDPSTGLSETNPASAESWHPMTPLLNSWALAAGNVTAQYRKVASPPNSVEIIGAITATAATSTTFFTLPAGYRPASRQQFATGATAGAGAGAVPYIQCAASTGVLTVEHATIGAADTYAFHGLIALDA